MLCVQGVKDPLISYSTPLSFSLSATQCITLVGGNGCGKTTLLKCLIGAHIPAVGNINRNVGCFFSGHQTGLSPHLTVQENLSLRFKLATGHTLTEQTLINGLEPFLLGQKISQKVGSLSAGEQKRVALSFALLTKSPLWILDEPLTNLDASHVNTLCHILRTHLSSGGGLVMSTHMPFFERETTMLIKLT